MSNTTEPNINGKCRGCNTFQLKGDERCLFGVPNVCTSCDIRLCTFSDLLSDGPELCLGFKLGQPNNFYYDYLKRDYAKK